MRRFPMLLAGCAMLGAAFHAAARPATVTDAEIATTTEHWRRLAHVPGVVVAHVRRGGEPAVLAFGEREHGVAMTPDDRFNAASLTKPVFAMVVLRLAAQGVVDLDASLASHWVDPDIADDPRHRAITLRLALSHQTGLPNWRDGRMTMGFAPGTRHDYSGEGYEYARRAIEAITHEDLASLAQRLVFAPAGMTRTSLGWSDAIEGETVTGHDAKGAPVDMKLRTRRPNAAANLITTAGDYARFTRWVLDGADLPRGLFADMARAQARHADPAEIFGLGWKLARLRDGTVLWHDGREPGTRTAVYLAPHDGEALVVMANGNHGELLFRPLVRAAMRRGDAITTRIARDVWRYLHAVPSEQLGAMRDGISRSPAFTSQLLFAADAGLLAPLLGTSRRQALHEAIDSFARARVEGRLDAASAATLIDGLVDTTDGTPHVRGRWSRKNASAWADRVIATASNAPGPEAR